jgi:general L-amino acid transport system substrate-binding protein
MFARILAVFALAALFMPPACAQTRLATIRARGHLACAAFERPSLARETPLGWTGFLPDICRAVAIAALGPDAHYQFKTLDPPEDEVALGSGDFDVLFLTETEIARNGLAGKVAPGPAVFFNSYAVMVEKGSAATKLEDLAGASICLHEADPAAEVLAETFAKKGKSFIAMPFQEDVEWRDAYNSRHCRAAASETIDLIELRLHRGVNGFDSVILPEKLAVFPILAATPLDDPQWSAGVAGVVDFLHGSRAIARDATALGLRENWRADVLAQVGDYGVIFARDLGEKSPYKLHENAP